MLYICIIVGHGCTDKRFDRKGDQIALNAAQVHGEMSIFARAVKGILIKMCTLKSLASEMPKKKQKNSQPDHQADTF